MLSTKIHHCGPSRGSLRRHHSLKSEICLAAWAGQSSVIGLRCQRHAHRTDQRCAALRHRSGDVLPEVDLDGLDAVRSVVLQLLIAPRLGSEVVEQQPRPADSGVSVPTIISERAAFAVVIAPHSLPRQRLSVHHRPGWPPAASRRAAGPSTRGLGTDAAATAPGPGAAPGPGSGPTNSRWLERSARWARPGWPAAARSGGWPAAGPARR